MPILETPNGEFVVTPLVPPPPAHPITIDAIRYDVYDADQEPYKPLVVRSFRISVSPDGRMYHVSHPDLPAGVPDPGARFTGSFPSGFPTPAEAVAAYARGAAAEVACRAERVKELQEKLDGAAKALQRAKGLLDSVSPWEDLGVRYALASNWRGVRTGEVTDQGNGLLVYRVIEAESGRLAVVNPLASAPFGPASLGFTTAGPEVSEAIVDALTGAPPRDTPAKAVRSVLAGIEMTGEEGWDLDEDDLNDLALLRAWLAELEEK